MKSPSHILVILALLCHHAVAQQFKVEDTFANYCSGCHGQNLDGGQGGSLVDGVWKHGGTDDEIFRSISKGNLQMGMTPWEGVLTPEQIRAMVIFLREKEKKAMQTGVVYPVPSTEKVTKTELHDYKIEIVVEKGINTPWAIAFLPDGRKLVTEFEGRLRMVRADGTLEAEPVKGTPEVIQHGQGGLMEVALHPDFASNEWVYLGLCDGMKDVTGETEAKPPTITSVVRGKIKDNTWTDQQWIYRAPPEFRSKSGVHYGTRFVFKDGYIFFPIGERGGMMQAQDLASPVGKIIRLHDDGTVPKDNPFVSNKDAIQGIWSYGHRNPQGLALDPRDGEIYSTEHGPRGGDELNIIKRGANYGWPVITYGMNYNGSPMVAITEKEGMEKPITYWVPSIAVCGLDFYTGDKFPKWKNDLFSGALAQQEVRRIRIAENKYVSQEIILKNIGRVRDVATGPDGYIYVLLNKPDRVIRIIPAL